MRVRATEKNQTAAMSRPSFRARPIDVTQNLSLVREVLDDEQAVTRDVNHAHKNLDKDNEEVRKPRKMNAPLKKHNVTKKHITRRQRFGAHMHPSDIGLPQGAFDARTCRFLFQWRSTLYQVDVATFFFRWTTPHNTAWRPSPRPLGAPPLFLCKPNFLCAKETCFKKYGIRFHLFYICPPSHQQQQQVLTKPIAEGKLSKDGKDKEIPIPEIRKVQSYEQDYRANYNLSVTYLRSESTGSVHSTTPLDTTEFFELGCPTFF